MWGIIIWEWCHQTVLYSPHYKMDIWYWFLHRGSASIAKLTISLPFHQSGHKAGHKEWALMGMILAADLSVMKQSNLEENLFHVYFIVSGNRPASQKKWLSERRRHKTMTGSFGVHGQIMGNAFQAKASFGLMVIVLRSLWIPSIQSQPLRGLATNGSKGLPGDYYWRWQFIVDAWNPESQITTIH